MSETAMSPRSAPPLLAALCWTTLCWTGLPGAPALAAAKAEAPAKSAGPSQAPARPVATPCDALADDPEDPFRAAPGVDNHLIDAAKAVPVCKGGGRGPRRRTAGSTTPMAAPCSGPATTGARWRPTSRRPTSTTRSPRT
ncbi:MAG: hypothetical protein WDN45_06140 [Caulobacteraceae bacterium]